MTASPAAKTTRVDGRFDVADRAAQDDQVFAGQMVRAISISTEAALSMSSWMR